MTQELNLIISVPRAYFLATDREEAAEDIGDIIRTTVSHVYHPCSFICEYISGRTFKLNLSFDEATPDPKRVLHIIRHEFEDGGYTAKLDK